MDNDKSTLEGGLHVVVFAGPNGSGKTSLIDELRQSGLKTVGGTFPLPEHFINPDQVAKDLPGTFGSQDERDLAAFHAAVAMRARAIERGEPFAFETVMSHPSRINELLMLKERGYQLLLTFITTDDPEKNVARVTQRYQTKTTTGHFVAPEKVRERYHRTLALLPKAVEVCDVSFVYDNSADFEIPKLQALISSNEFEVALNAKPWVHDKLVHPLQQREAELAEIVAKIMRGGSDPVFADLLDGAYAGTIIEQTQYYVAQVEEGTGKVVIHDRLMLDATLKAKDRASSTYAENESVTITYTRQGGPRVTPSTPLAELKLDNVVPIARATKL